MPHLHACTRREGFTRQRWGKTPFGPKRPRFAESHRLRSGITAAPRSWRSMTSATTKSCTPQSWELGGEGRRKEEKRGAAAEGVEGRSGGGAPCAEAPRNAADALRQQTKNKRDSSRRAPAGWRVTATRARGRHSSLSSFSSSSSPLPSSCADRSCRMRRVPSSRPSCLCII